MARTGVTIDSGELPSARGVTEGYPLSNVITRWQHVAAGSFREDCRFLKQIIEETDELRLWEKNVGGFTYASRDEFLRKQVLIDFDLTERDMTEIVALLKQDDVESVKARLLGKKGEFGRGRPKSNRGSPTTSIGRGKAYQEERLKRDFPDIWAAFERGEFKSVKAAAIAAGIIKPTTPLDLLRKAWKRASPSEREAFLAEISQSRI